MNEKKLLNKFIAKSETLSKGISHAILLRNNVVFISETIFINIFKA